MHYQLLVLMLEASDREEIRFSLLDDLKNKETLQYIQHRLNGYQNHRKQLHYIAGRAAGNVSWTAATWMHVKQSDHVWTKRTCYNVMNRESGIQYVKPRNCFDKNKCLCIEKCMVLKSITKQTQTKCFDNSSQSQVVIVWGILCENTEFYFNRKRIKIY